MRFLGRKRLEHLARKVRRVLRESLALLVLPVLKVSPDPKAQRGRRGLREQAAVVQWPP